MLLIIGLLITATVLVSVVAIRPKSTNAAPLGRMSEAWLAAQRMVRPSQLL
jgi:hypothetical protein